MTDEQRKSLDQLRPLFGDKFAGVLGDMWAHQDERPPEPEEQEPTRLELADELDRLGQRKDEWKRMWAHATNLLNEQKTRVAELEAERAMKDAIKEMYRRGCLQRDAIIADIGTELANSSEQMRGHLSDLARIRNRITELEAENATHAEALGPDSVVVSRKLWEAMEAVCVAAETGYREGFDCTMHSLLDSAVRSWRSAQKEQEADPNAG